VDRRDDERHGAPPQTLPRPAATPAGRAAAVALHVAPGVVAYALLHHARVPLQQILGLSSAVVQIGVIMTGAVMLLMLGGGALALARAWDRLAFAETLRAAGATRLDWAALALAVALWGALIAVPDDRLYGDRLAAWLQRQPVLEMPAWHFQVSGGFAQLPPVLAAVALVANVVCEELYFRGYLFAKLSFLGPATWLVTGLLFTSYHVFQAPLSYPGVLGGLALAGLYQLRGNLWACVLLHTLLQAPL
jgi:membrane protease YdiL (CAAX protease family)